MTVKKLWDILKDFDDDVDVMTKKTEVLGNIGEVNSVRKDSCGLMELMYLAFCLQMNMSRRKRG